MQTNVNHEFLKGQIRTILLATDFLPVSRLALDYAAAFAHHFAARLVIVNVFELDPVAQNVELVDHMPSRTRRESEARLSAFTSDVTRRGISANSLLVEGTVPGAILSTFAKINADLLVIGTQGVHLGLNHLIIGSNTEALMLGTQCPTVTIGPHVHGGFGVELGLELGFRRIICVSDLTIASAVAGRTALVLAQSLGSEVNLYHLLPHSAVSDPNQVPRLVEAYCNALKVLEQKGQTIPLNWQDPEYHLARVYFEEQVLAASTDTTALIVLGVEPRSYLGRHLHTSFAYRLLANAACPVLTVPNKFINC
jgi:nucleotide-binding universal stress UspA family protein